MKIHNVNFSFEWCELHNCMRDVMRLCRWFGFFPVVGLDGPLSTNLRFSYKSAYIIYSVATMFGQVLLAGCNMYAFFTDKLSLSSTSDMLFYVNSLLTGIFLWHLAKHWPSLVQKAKEIEQSITELKISLKVPLKLKAVAYSMLILALVEHLLSLVHGWDVVTSCTHDLEIYDLLIKFYVIRMPPVLILLYPVTVWSAFFYQIASFQATFLWTFLDVMIICISMYLTEYFKELNKLMMKQKQKFQTAAMWEKIRITHCSLITLVNIINSRLGHCVLLAFFTDLFYICQQLYKILSETRLNYSRTCKSLELAWRLRGPIQYVYYSYSFLFLVARVFVLSVMAANVNTVAQRPRLALAEVPASIYNIVIERFLRQINYTTIAISGWFFYVTRRMILKVAGTIITYELVMLQFQQLGKVTDGHALANNTN